VTAKKDARYFRVATRGEPVEITGYHDGHGRPAVGLRIDRSVSLGNAAIVSGEDTVCSIAQARRLQKLIGRAIEDALSGKFQ
jgi:hypothetical protein